MSKRLLLELSVEWRNLKEILRREKRLGRLIPMDYRSITSLARDPALITAKERGKKGPFMRGIVTGLRKEPIPAANEAIVVLQRIIRICAAEVIELELDRISSYLDEARGKPNDGSCQVWEGALVRIYPRVTPLIESLQAHRSTSVNSVTGPLETIADSPGFPVPLRKACGTIHAALQTLSLTGAAFVPRFAEVNQSAVEARMYASAAMARG